MPEDEKRETSEPQDLRVTVVGGGVLGLSTAAHLARRGVRVTVLTDAGLASGASGRSLAWLNSFGTRSPDYHRLRMVGLERYRDLSSRARGAEQHLRFNGGLTWVSPERLAERRAAHQHMERIGYAATWVTPEEVTALAPGVAAEAVPAEGAVFNPQEGWVDLPWLVRLLAEEVERSGGEVREHAGRCELVVTGDRVSGVRTADGALVESDAAVLAIGGDVPRAASRLGSVLPDATPIALLVRTPPIATRLRAVLNTPRVAVRPTPDGGLVMDAGWAEGEVEVLPDGSYRAHDETVQGLLAEASAVLAGHPTLTCASIGMGPKPVPGDGEPVVGPLDGVSGCFVAFTHSGATLGLVVGELLAERIVDGELPSLLRPFQPSRFG